ncbi:MAG: hypothetical protein ACI4FO_00735 [Acutalibacteraceae bacterium]
MSIFDKLKKSVTDAVNPIATKNETLTTLTSFEKITLRVIGMRYDIEYEILNKPPNSVIVKKEVRPLYFTKYKKSECLEFKRLVENLIVKVSNLYFVSSSCL